GNVRSTPWLYEFFYASLWRMRWFADASKRFVGGWCGRRLAPKIAALRPDIVLSTYPLGSAGLAWLRTHRRLEMPVGAWVSDFAPHPFWVYDGLDQHFVMHPVAVETARRCVPGAPVTAAAVPVVRAFAPGDRTAARQRGDLPEDAFVALVSCGSLGFGDVEDAVRELLAAAPRVLPVVACGRNEDLRRRVAAIDPRRVRALGWTDEMPQLTVAADVVVTNAGGATSLEALACGRPVLMYRPIAAHGKANAALMAQAGLAQVTGKGELTPSVRRLCDEPETLRTMEKTATEHATGRSIADDLRELAAVTPARAPEPLPAADAMFLHVQTPQVPQQVSAVLMFDRKPDGDSITVADAAFMLAAAPRAGGRLIPGTAWRRARWQPDPDIDIQDAIDEVETADLIEAMDAFFSVGVTMARPCVGRVVHGLPGDRSALMFKLHHALGDGMVVIWALVAKTRDEQFIAEARQPRGAAPTPRGVARGALRGAKLVSGGLWQLVTAGRAPRSPLDGATASAERHHGVAEFPSERIVTAANAYGVRRTEFLLALVGEALHRTADPGDRVRVMVTRSTRSPKTLRLAGNHTGAASVDLPTGAMPFRERALGSQRALRAQVRSGAPETAAMVLRLLGFTPPWLHAKLSRLVYSSTWFNVITSMLPGEETSVALKGAPLPVVYPVLALAPGVGMSVGLMTWLGKVTVCISAAPDVVPFTDDFIAALHQILAEVERP
ncbi:MAG: WS/DGAT domain-containing protein, partial [Sciscionella sp.]